MQSQRSRGAQIPERKPPASVQGLVHHLTRGQHGLQALPKQVSAISYSSLCVVAVFPIILYPCHLSGGIYPAWVRLMCVLMHDAQQHESGTFVQSADAAVYS